jgi:hypothetical protein
MQNVAQIDRLQLLALVSILQHTTWARDAVPTCMHSKKIDVATCYDSAFMNVAGSQ